MLTDAVGQQVSFIGSDNESASGWRANHESFTVAKSSMDQVWSEQGAPLCRRFEDPWSGRPDQGWAVTDLPDAVAERLVAHAPDERPPVRDPAEGRRDGDHARERDRDVMLDAARVAFVLAQ